MRNVRPDALVPILTALLLTGCVTVQNNSPTAGTTAAVPTLQAHHCTPDCARPY